MHLGIIFLASFLARAFSSTLASRQAAFALDMMLGITTGFATTLRTAIIPELVPLDEIGAVRSTLTAVMVLASAIGPAIYGWMFAADIDIGTTLWITIVAMAVVSVLSWMSERPGFYIPPGVARQTGE